VFGVSISAMPRAGVFMPILWMWSLSYTWFGFTQCYERDGKGLALMAVHFSIYYALRVVILTKGSK
jgi:hypothetical protein